MGVIIFNNKSSADCRIQVAHPPGYAYPERDYTITHIPGRNGDIIQDNGCYKNIERTYEVSFDVPNEDFATYANAVSAWLHSTTGYARLEDSYEPNYYRMATYQESNIFENLYNQAGTATIVFECKPQRFLKTGDNTITIQNSLTIMNPTGFEAYPLFKVTGTSGMLTVNGNSITFSSIDDFVMLDCELQDAYKENINKNSTISGTFPVLKTGSNTISWTGNISSVTMKPRWWTI